MPQIPIKNKSNIFPIEVTLEFNGVIQKAKAYKVNEMGMMLEVFASVFTPQQVLKLKWTLPIDNIAMEEDAVVVKKYTQTREDKMLYLVEVHFKNVKAKNVDAIKSLLERHEQLLKKQNEKKSGS